MQPEISFRTATADDAPLLTDLRIRFALELSGEQPGAAVDALRRQMRDYFRKATQEGSIISILAACDGTTVGIGTVHLRDVPGNFRNPSGRWGYIMNMYTDTGYRKRGICGRILALLQEEAAKVGVTAFELHATELGKPVYLNGGFYIHNEPTLRKINSL